MNTENQNLTEDQETIFPTTANEEGFFFQDQDEKDAGIETKVYENKLKVKKCILPEMQKVAVVRQLKAKDMLDIKRRMDGNPEKYSMASAVVATKIDDKPTIIEEVNEMLMKDYNLIMQMHQALNF